MLTRLCVGYEKADEETCNKMIKAINEYDALQKNKKGLLTRIQTRIEAIGSKEDGEIFDNVFLNTDLSSPLKVKEAIDYIKSKGRTTASNKYINALASASPDNIKKAQTFQKPIAKISNLGGIGLIILGIVLLFTEAGVVWSLLSAAVGIILLVYYYNLKKVWNCLTLNGSIVHKMISLSGKEERNEVAKKVLETDEAEKKAKFQEEYEKMMRNKDKKE